MRTLILHLGAHKTATTFLQRNFAANADKITSCKFFSVHSPDAAFNEFRRSYSHDRNTLLLRTGATERSAVAESLTEKLSKLFESCSHSTIILSDENLFGPTPGHTRIPTLYPGSRGMAKAFAALKGFDKIKVRLYIRRQDSLLLSSYKDYIAKLIGGLSLVDFIAKQDLSGYAWNEVIAPWTKQIDAFEVSVVPYELIYQGADHYFHEFIQFCGIEGTVTVSPSRVNEGLSARQCRFAALVANELRPKERKPFRRFLQNAIKSDDPADNEFIWDNNAVLDVVRREYRTLKTMIDAKNPSAMAAFKKHYAISDS
jgi:hypothetical protein